MSDCVKYSKYDEKETKVTSEITNRLKDKTQCLSLKSDRNKKIQLLHLVQF